MRDPYAHQHEDAGAHDALWRCDAHRLTRRLILLFLILLFIIALIAPGARRGFSVPGGVAHAQATPTPANRAPVAVDDGVARVRRAEMVRAFIESLEYRERFGRP